MSLGLKEGEHVVRDYGACSHRFRGRVREAAAAGTTVSSVEPVPPAEPGSAEAKRRSSWTRVLQKVFEVAPLLSPRCQAQDPGSPRSGHHPPVKRRGLEHPPAGQIRSAVAPITSVRAQRGRGRHGSGVGSP